MNNRRYFFTSDTHYSHRNSIKYCSRPFADEFEMNEKMIENWNRVVRPNDIVFHLGDVSFEKDQRTIDNLLSRLAGEKHLIEGNHDGRLNKWHRHFKTRKAMDMIFVPPEANNGNEQAIVLCHYPFKAWNMSHFGSWALHGHCHGNLPDDPMLLSCDVGVDVWNYTPVSMEQLNEVMSKKTFKPRNYHHDAK